MKFEYYTISNSTDEKIVGREYPQVDCLTQARAHAISSWQTYSNVKTLKFELNKKAKLTDVLSDVSLSGSTGLLINDKVKAIFEKFNLMNHQYFDAIVVTPKDGEIPYSWLHLSDPEMIHKLDYTKSIFFRTEYTFREEEIELASYAEYERHMDDDKDASFGVELDKIALNDSFDRSIELFTFLPFDNEIYISKELCDELLNNEITGIELEKASNFIS